MTPPSSMPISFMWEGLPGRESVPTSLQVWRSEAGRPSHVSRKWCGRAFSERDKFLGFFDYIRDCFSKFSRATRASGMVIHIYSSHKSPISSHISPLPPHSTQCMCMALYSFETKSGEIVCVASLCDTVTKTLPLAGGAPACAGALCWRPRQLAA